LSRVPRYGRLLIAALIIIAGLLVIVRLGAMTSDSAELAFVVRLVHVVAGLAWLGEVATVNFVLLPALSRATPGQRVTLLELVFPLVFRLATVLAGTAVAAGLVLALAITDGDLLSLFDSARGLRIVIGGTLGAGLFAFHLFQESGMEGSLATRLAATRDDPEAADLILRRLRIVPRVGLALLLVIVVLMSAAARLA